MAETVWLQADKKLEVQYVLSPLTWQTSKLL